MNFPLVSCLMNTRNRRRFVPGAIRCFLAQTYPGLELLVLDDGEDHVVDLVPKDPRIRYRRTTRRLNLGEARNSVAEMAQGEIFVLWDDDDFHPPDRVERQVLPILRGGVEITGTSRAYFFDPDQNEEAWLYQYPDVGEYLLGATMVFTRYLWEWRHFPPIAVGEDTTWMTGLRDAGIKLHDLADPRLYVASIHARNTAPRNPQANSVWSRASVEMVRTLWSGRGDTLDVARGE